MKFQNGLDFKPEIIVMIDGGLGSQMWQYAVGRCAEWASGLPVHYDLGWYVHGSKDLSWTLNRNFELTSVFPDLPFKEADKETCLMYKMFFNLYKGIKTDFVEEFFSSKSARYLGGYYIGSYIYKHFDQQGDALRELFQFKLDMTGHNQIVLAQILSAQCPVAIHIRRGDFVGSIHDITTPRYFYSAIRYMNDKIAPEKATFFVFSNGMEWSREILRDMDEDFVFVDVNDNDKGAFDMYLMSQCSHFIISNSGFGWWSAWLSRRSQHKIVIRPDRLLATLSANEQPTMQIEGWYSLPVD